VHQSVAAQLPARSKQTSCRREALPERYAMTFTPDVETAARLRFLDDVLVGKRDSCARKRPLCKIKALSRTRPGKTSDKRTADDEHYRFPPRSTLWKDTGFQGYEPPKVRTYQPKKKPPKGELTSEEKATNQAISRKRVRIEHSIGGAKVFHIARDVFRNRRSEYVDLSFETACGLHNLRCDYRLSATA